KVLDHDMELTELNEAGPVITETEIKQLKEKILSLIKPDDLVVLSGNVSYGVRKNIYRELIELVKQQGARVVLDADGELFAEGIQAKPYVIKPNKYELATYFGVSQECSNEEIISLARTLLNDECRLVVVSMGKEGSIFLSNAGIYQAEALHIQAHSSVGAGDAMVAAIAYALEQDYDMEQLIALAVACSAGAVMTKGTQPADQAVVDTLMKQVIIQKLEEN
ncbi:MAG: PfkB family carbohydrate kinase, partial [Clostridium sp.]|nr:PfkB family carbohydrate kinase [Clostridium sp.]